MTPRAEDGFDLVLRRTLALVALGAVVFLLLMVGVRGADLWIIIFGALFARRPVPAESTGPGDTLLRREIRRFLLPATLAIGAGCVAARLAPTPFAQLLLGLLAVTAVSRGYYRIVDR